MNIKTLSFLVVLLMTSSLFAQSSLNNYKYIIIPKQYDFLREADKFQLNSLTEFLFNKYGFKAYMEEGNYPDDLKANRCLALTSNLIKDSSMFKTRLMIELKNCNGLTVYTTQAGESREKDFKTAYSEALRNAFKELQNINYKYVPAEQVSENIINKEPNNQADVSKEIAQLKAEIENLKQEKETPVVIAEESKVTEAVIEVSKTVSASQNTSDVLYAQAIENGFQLVDSSPKVVYKIKNTSMENMFLVEGRNATLYKKGDHWIMEYYENNVLKQDVLNIKF
ncbi:MAG: hypothetical protein B7Z06_07255 [Flavobacteriales bacterium 32-35-8]|nr:MAG: hypothetical protein B7Z06_07255 [Flavobacteriales bacterium 32-35-8]